MADKAWKAFEREIARLIGGARFWANSGESLDCESHHFVAQCKHVKSMSLNAVAQLAEEIKQDGEDNRTPTGLPAPKYGILALKTRPGKGKKSTTLIVMEQEVFRQLVKEGER